MKRRDKQDGWFSVRGYPHLDRPLSFASAKALATSPERVARHSFLPLLSYTDKNRQFRTDNSDRTIPKKLRPRIFKDKEREIKYASHADASIFSFYAMKLQEFYEAWLQKHNLQDSVIGYRSGLGSNVDMAAEAFSEAASRGTVTALCFDISNFFPSISHNELKSTLELVTNQRPLPFDWYKVFRSCTKFSHVDLKDLSKLLGFSLDPSPRPLVDDLPMSMKVIRKSDLLKTNNSKVEIPQGTPISAMMANVSMANFDIKVSSWALDNSAFYRRYSDDILLLVSPELERSAISVITTAAGETGEGLEINPEKTEISRFKHEAGHIHVDRPMTYLGFTFDGQAVTIRARTLSRYYRRMTYAARGTVKGAGKAGQPAAKAFRRTIYRDLTHLGSANFYQYAKRADSKFHQSSVKRQLRRHFRILIRKLENRGR